MSQLSAESGVAVATIKYYLREGLLHEGLRTSATGAEYDAGHLDRLRLVRALVADSGVSVAETRRLLGTLADPPASAYELLGAAQHAVGRTPEVEPAERAAALTLLHDAGWNVAELESDAADGVADALARTRSAGLDIPPRVLRGYLDLMLRLGRLEIDGVPTASAAEAVRYVVLGSVLAEPLLLALRRLAEHLAAAERFPGGAPLAGADEGA